MGEHLPCKQGVRSSTLLVSTILEARNEKWEARKNLSIKYGNHAPSFKFLTSEKLVL